VPLVQGPEQGLRITVMFRWVLFPALSLGVRGACWYGEGVKCVDGRADAQNREVV
jgi:hypothetical protein